MSHVSLNAVGGRRIARGLSAIDGRSVFAAGGGFVPVVADGGSRSICRVTFVIVKAAAVVAIVCGAFLAKHPRSLIDWINRVNRDVFGYDTSGRFFTAYGMTITVCVAAILLIGGLVGVVAPIK